MWAGPRALENTVQEMLGTAEQLLTDDECVAVIRAIKSRRVTVHELGDGGDGGQLTAE